VLAVVVLDGVLAAVEVVAVAFCVAVLWVAASVAVEVVVAAVAAAAVVVMFFALQLNMFLKYCDDMRHFLFGESGGKLKFIDHLIQDGMESMVHYAFMNLWRHWKACALIHIGACALHTYCASYH
jgi:hypothetical protein